MKGGSGNTGTAQKEGEIEEGVGSQKPLWLNTIVPAHQRGMYPRSGVLLQLPSLQPCPPLTGPLPVLGLDGCAGCAGCTGAVCCGAVYCGAAGAVYVGVYDCCGAVYDCCA